APTPTTSKPPCRPPARDNRSRRARAPARSLCASLSSCEKSVRDRARPRPYTPSAAHSPRQRAKRARPSLTAGRLAEGGVLHPIADGLPLPFAQALLALDEPREGRLHGAERHAHVLGELARTGRASQGQRAQHAVFDRSLGARIHDEQRP